MCYEYSKTLDGQGFNYPMEMFAMAEFEIFKRLGFNLLIPTAADLIMQILFLEKDQDEQYSQLEQNTRRM